MVVAVNDVSFTANDGHITGLLGANGAGKTTSLRAVAGLIKPDEGVVKLDGHTLNENMSFSRENLGYMPHNSGLYPRATAIENIEYYAQLSGVNSADIRSRVNELVELLDMKSFCERRTEGFSQGQKTKVALARALVHKPKNIILDEPTNGLDVMATRSLRKVLRRLKDQGHCVLISSHIMQEITQLCDQVAIINEGRVVIEDSVQGILDRTQKTDFEEAFVAVIQPGFGVQ